jgi:putative transposase
MPINEKYLAPLEAGKIYHIYNKTNNKEKLFLKDENYAYFLRRTSVYISPYFEIYAWVLLTNHFHIMVRVKEEKEIKEILQKRATEDKTKNDHKYLEGNIGLHEFLATQWQKLFTSYAMAFNKIYSRSGNLFYRQFKRIVVDSDSHISTLAIYIHTNAQKHGIVKDFRNYKWSSWHTYMSDTPTNLNKKFLLDWFGGIDNFKYSHIKNSELSSSFDSAIEDAD